MRIALGMIAHVFAAALAMQAGAQTFPARPVTMVVPFAAGGPTDTIALTIAEAMQKALGKPVVVENVSGAAGGVGVARVVQAVPDGHTIGIGHWSTHVLNGAIYRLSYDLVADLAPIALVASNPQIIVGKSAAPASDLKSLIAWLKQNPGRALQGTAGTGSPSHVAGVYFQRNTDTQFQFVPYRGGAPAMQALVAGQMDLGFEQAANALPHVRVGAIKAYAVTADTRLAAAPDIPTVDEAGLSGFHVAVWHGLWAPKATPKDVIAALNAAVVAALADAAVRKRLADLGQEAPAREQQTPQALAARQKAEIEKWWPIVKAAGIKAE